MKGMIGKIFSTKAVVLFASSTTLVILAMHVQLYSSIKIKG